YAPDRVQPGLHRALGPAGSPGDVVAGQEQPAMLGREFPLHEMAEHPMLIAVVTRQIALESAHEMRVGFPRDRDGLRDDMAADVEARIDLRERMQHDPHPLL